MNNIAQPNKQFMILNSNKAKTKFDKINYPALEVSKDPLTGKLTT